MSLKIHAHLPSVGMAGVLHLCGLGPHDQTVSNERITQLRKKTNCLAQQNKKENTLTEMYRALTGLRFRRSTGSISMITEWPAVKTTSPVSCPIYPVQFFRASSEYSSVLQMNEIIFSRAACAPDACKELLGFSPRQPFDLIPRADVPLLFQYTLPSMEDTKEAGHLVIIT